MKPDEFIDNKDWVIRVFPKKEIQHISRRSSLKTLCGRFCGRSIVFDLYAGTHLCITCVQIYRKENPK